MYSRYVFLQNIPYPFAKILELILAAVPSQTLKVKCPYGLTLHFTVSKNPATKPQVKPNFAYSQPKETITVQYKIVSPVHCYLQLI